MTIATQIPNTDPMAPANAGTPNGDTPQSPDQSGIAAPSAPVSGQPTTPAAGTDDPTHRLAKLTTETIPQLQSERDTAKSKVTELEATITDLTAQLEESPDEEELTYQIAHERDEAYLGWLQKALRDGNTLQQVVRRFEADAQSARAGRQSFESTRANVEGLINVIGTYDKPFSEFLAGLHKTGNAVINQTTVPGLRTLYDSFKADGKSPAQAAAAAATTTPGKEPPVVAPPGGAALADAPVWKPGMSASDLFDMALKGRFGQNGERPKR